MPKLVRGGEFVSNNGIARSIRLEPVRNEQERIGNWSWSDNRFYRTREMNKAIYPISGERYYVVRDLGASFGKTGGIGSRTKSRLDHYAEAKFMEEVEADVAI